MKLKIKQPTELKDIKLSQYKRFVVETKGVEDDDLINRKLVSIFCGIPEKYVGSINKKQYDSIVEGLHNVLKEQPELTTRFKLDGVEYGFIPDLEEITVDEHSDLDTTLKDVKTWDLAMGVCYRKVTHKRGSKYLIEEYKGEGVKLDLTLDIVFGAVAFFLTLQKELLTATLNYISQEVENTPKHLEILEKNGVGIKTITHLQAEIYKNLPTWEKLNLTKH